jgi:hypothetical protein
MINKVDIEQFKGVHKGKRLFILASGPSLSTLDLEPLKRRLVMGLNRSFMVFPDTHYHCTMDRRLFDLHAEPLRRTRYLFTIPGCPWGTPLGLLGSEGFSRDLKEGIFSGYTISYFAIQVAVYMGFEQIFILGLDLKHKGAVTHFFGRDFHSRNHESTEFPRMKKMLCQAALELKGSGVQVYNCSPDSSLECFPKMSYEEAIAL